MLFVPITADYWGIKKDNSARPKHQTFYFAESDGMVLR